MFANKMCSIFFENRRYKTNTVLSRNNSFDIEQGETQVKNFGKINKQNEVVVGGERQTYDSSCTSRMASKKLLFLQHSAFGIFIKVDSFLF